MSYENAARQQLRRKWWLRAVGILACVVVFITVYALVLPAITMEGTPTCGLEEHTHDAECYDAEGVLICTLEEHVHDAACYAEDDTELAEPEPDAEEPAPEPDAEEPVAEPDAEPADAEPADVAKETDDVEDEEPVLAAPVLRAPLLGAGGSSGSIAPSVPTGSTNEWQIVDGIYEGNAADNKSPSADGNVRIQKNVVPTNVENEFLVYLGIDVESVVEVTTEVVGQYLIDSSYILQSHMESHDHTFRVDRPVQDTPQGSDKQFSIGSNPKHLKYGPLHAKIIRYSTNELVGEYDFYTEIPNCTLYLKLQNGKYLKLGSFEGSKPPTDNYIVYLGEEAYNELIEDIKSTTSVSKTVDLEQVVDTLGDSIIFEGIVDKYGSAEENDNIITWIPEINPNAEKETVKIGDDENSVTTTWIRNASELVYKVKLDVTSPEFKSCADTISDKSSSAKYAVNNSAVLSYKDFEGKEQSAVFEVPTVRGLLYDLAGTKVDTLTNKPMEGVTFTVTGPNGYSKEVVTDKDGHFSVVGLPWGEYSVKETGTLEGYDVDGHTAAANLCYTQNKELIASTENDTHMMAKDQSGFRFEDRFILPNIVLVKHDAGQNALSGAEFQVIGPVEATGTSGADGKILAITAAPSGDYTVTETKAPAGYNLLADSVNLKVNGTDVSAKIGDKPIANEDITSVVDTETGITTVTIVIHNNPGVVLPETGGMGTVIFTISGLTLMAAAMILLSKQRKRNEA